jgi:myo-inositol-1(or 4)-monophosphatase
VVTPVDGTTNYAAGLPWYAFGLALLDGRGPVVGVLSDPSRAEVYAAARGRGMRTNGIPVRLTATPAPGLPVCTEWGQRGGWPGLPAFLGRAADARREVRVLGSAALAVTQVALGHAAATVLPEQPEHAVAAALALAMEAGAVVLDGRGLPSGTPEGGLLVAAPSVAAEVLQWWRAATAPGRSVP